MWSCKKCETLNEEGNSVCMLCGALRMTPEPTAKQAQTEPQPGANYRYAQPAGKSAPRTGSEEKPRNAGGFKILAVVLFAFLAVAVGVIVFLISRAPAPTGELAQATQQDTAQTPDDAGKDGKPIVEDNLSAPPTQTVCGDVTLTVESHCQYLANIIPTNDSIDMPDGPVPESIYEANNFLFIVTDCVIINFLEPLMGDQPLAGATVQLTNLDTGDIREVISDADGVCAQIDDVVPGEYVYSIRLEGYETYTSNPFTVRSASSESEATMPMFAALIAEGRIYSDNFTIQLTDLDGKPISNRTFGSIMIYTCQQSGQQLLTISGVFIGDYVDDQGVIASSSNFDQQSLNSLLKDSMVLIVFEELTERDENGTPEQYIIIRAE
ncbi:MAG: carboxypeptidase regulatory-like domain-containing protein [Clostridiaceae bacterium]